MISAKTTVNTNPFPGLRPFDERENHLFFGRESQVDEMLNKLNRNRFLAVIGTSGSGKSSLVNCGLFPALHGGYLTSAGSSWRVAKFRPGNNPIREMALALSQKGTLFLEDKIGNLPVASMINVNLLRSKLGLIETFKQARLKPHENLLVVVDQFEELFRYKKVRALGTQDEENAVSFINLLLESVRQSKLPIYVVITMRSDFLGDCAQFRGLPEMINDGQYLVPRMRRSERKSAIVGPVEVAGAKMTERLLMRLVNDVGDNPDQLSILQHALNRTWAAWEKDEKTDGPLDLPHYQKIGTMSKALDQHAEKAFHELPDDRHKLVCQKIFKALTDVGTESRGVRRPSKMGKLCEITEATEEEVKTVIEVFRKPSRSFLMPPAGTPLDDGTIVDISHESFMRIWKRLIRWTREEQESVRTYLRLSDAAMLYEQGKTALMTDPYLQFALNWQEEEKVNQAWAERYDDHFMAVVDYIRKSRREKQLKEAEAKAAAEAEQKRKEDEQEAKLRSQRKRFTIARILGAIFFVLTGAMVYLYYELNEEKEESENLKAGILSHLGFSNESVSMEDLPNVFEVRDIQDSILLIESGGLESTDQNLASLFNTIHSEQYEKFLSQDYLDDIKEKEQQLQKYDEAFTLDSDENKIVIEKLDAWKQAALYERNTANYATVQEKIALYTEIIDKYAVILNENDIRFLKTQPTSDNILDPGPSEEEFIVGNGTEVYVWVNAEAPENEGIKLTFYSEGEPIRFSTKAKDNFPTWTVQHFNPDQANKASDVKIFNSNGDLIGRKSFTLLP